jgi:hypothetical protein
MVEFGAWTEANWFNVFQTVGIVGGLILAAAAAVREARAREIQNLLTISDQHREVWSELLMSPELKRILQRDADISAEPPTSREEASVNLVIVQYLKAWRIARMGGLLTLKELAVDISGFFSFPLPLAVWEKTTRFRNRRFVRFVEQALRATPGNYRSERVG